MLTLRFVVLAFAVVAFPVWGMSDEPRVAFPSNYKSEFKNYLQADRLQNADQTISLFANTKALEAAKSNQEFPDGSILVGEIYAARKDAEGKVATSALGRRINEKLAAIAVMEKRAGWGNAFSEDLRNEDWDFAIFSPDGKRLDKDLNTCRSCHAPLKQTQHVFSLEHIK